MKIKSKLLSGILGVILMSMCFGHIADAANVVEVPSTEIDGVLYQEVDSNTLENWPAGPQIYSESGIVMDMDSGAILYAKNIDDQHYPASITKVATALVALQHYEMDEIVKFTWDDIGFLEYGDAHIAMKEDEEISMEDAMYGMLLASANEVSHAIGAHMEGGYDTFLEVMNETTKELGCTNSNWMNTHGLHDAEHYTSARDMALISSAVFQYEKFREITATYQHVIPETSMTAEKRYVHQNHKMIRDWDNRYYEYCVGGKTGYTDQALSTLVTFATKDDLNLVAVVMRTHGGGNNAYADTRAMLDYAFDNFSKTVVTEEMIIDERISKLSEGEYLLLPNGVTITQLTPDFVAPTQLKDKTGTMSFSYMGQPVGKVEVTITDEYYNLIHGIKEEKEVKEKEKTSVLTVILWILLVVVIVFFAAVAGLLALVYYKRKQREKRRRQRREAYRRQREREL
ncbi:MAG: D-alanyl-D-alanine carboxypeptidase family protein [Faecalimonas sp.]|nr:D-alanyl-D-alanine carboxypeptidase family protein [Faecalimonas sp.]